MLNFFAYYFYAYGSANYSSIPAYYSNLLSNYAHEESMIEEIIIIILNNNKGLYLVPQRWFLRIRRRN